MAESKLELFGEEVLYTFSFYCGVLEGEEFGNFIKFRKDELEDVCTRLVNGFAYFEYSFSICRFDPSANEQNGECISMMNSGPVPLSDIRERAAVFKKNYVEMFDKARISLKKENDPVNVSLYVRAWREGIYKPPEGKRLNIFGEVE